MAYPRRRDLSFDPIPHPAEALPITADLPFHEAAQRWLRSRRVEPTIDDPTLEGISPARRVRRYHPLYIRPRTLQSYTDYVRALTLFFEDKPLCSITGRDLRRYQAERSRGDAPFLRKRKPDADPAPSPVSAKKVNQELQVLIIMLRGAGLWNRPISAEYEQLVEDMTEIRRALTLEEEIRWLAMSRSEERLLVVNWYSTLALRTCMSTNELRLLKVGDIHPDASVIKVSSEASKNIHRHRTVPLDDPDAQWSVRSLLRRAGAIGSVEPHHYIFPFRTSGPYGRYIPVKPMGDSGIKKPWQEVREKTGLDWFRQYDLRHTAITRFAETGWPISVIMSMAGHVSDRMRQHYTHISESNQRRWMENTRARRGVRSPDPPRRPGGEGGAPPTQSNWGLSWTSIP